jgi:glycosyltransferase involved in cell wall biosynthesis
MPAEAQGFIASYDEVPRSVLVSTRRRKCSLRSRFQPRDALSGVMHVLAKQLPGAGDSGGRQRLEAFVKYYASRYQEVNLWGHGFWNNNVPSNVSVHPFAEPRSLKLSKLVSTSIFAAKWFSQGIADGISSSYQSGDSVHIDFPQMMVNLPPDIPVTVLDFHNVESLLMKSRLSESARTVRYAAANEIRRLRGLERTSMERARIVTCCSDSDAKALASISPASSGKVALIDNGVRNIPPSFPTLGSVPTIGFVGSFDYSPNMEALEWFISRVWPLIKAERTDVRFLIAGRHAVLAAKLRLPTDVRVISDPADIMDVYKDISVSVAPLLSGGGTKIKVLEGIANGRISIATEEGARGLEEYSEFIDVAGDAQAFADKLAFALSFANHAELDGRSRAAYVFASARCSWESRLEILDSKLFDTATP